MIPHRVEVTYRDERARNHVLPDEVERVVRTVLEHEAWDGSSVSIVIVDDEEIAEIHGEFCGDPDPTDVISFDLRDEDGTPGEELGAELVTSWDTACRVAQTKGHEPTLELLLYVVHGLCHLLGEEDHTDEQRERMRDRERSFFDKLALPYPF